MQDHERAAERRTASIVSEIKRHLRRAVAKASVALTGLTLAFLLTPVW
ncbi:hypothetical protein SAMN04488063_3005 [Halopelagius inordinatus]|uniref:Uncharacterized protein n=1 Tax=Halopelagius inordinatus TaxID=553467 RepID=A0A1I2UTL3_9EURY|nr:hypothetical protein [Halopelagius inordinatus]SFG80464.1 hypothetical protein SAMN04488063_3005 [Halopelagius inordinatus]